MKALRLLLAAMAFAAGSVLAPGLVGAEHLPGKTVVLIGGAGDNLGETPWQMLRDQFSLRGFLDSNVLEFQYAGGSFEPDGAWKPNPGGLCESYARASFQTLRKMLSDMLRVRPDHEVFLVGHGSGGFVATMALWAAALGPEDPAVWTNLSGIASIGGPMSGLSETRATFLQYNAVNIGCSDISMIDWMTEVGDARERFAESENRAARAMEKGYKIGSFGNTIDCAYRYAADICPNMRKRAGERAVLLPLLGDERLTMFIKNGTLSREYNVSHPVPDEVFDNHQALLLDGPVMAEVAEFVLSQVR